MSIFNDGDLLKYLDSIKPEEIKTIAKNYVLILAPKELVVRVTRKQIPIICDWLLFYGYDVVCFLQDRLYKDGTQRILCKREVCC